MQKLEIIGRLGGNPKVTTTKNGSFMLTFDVAASRRWRNKAGVKQEVTTWYSCYAYHNAPPKVSDYLNKGSLVFVSGQPGVNAYVDSAGAHKASITLLIDELELLDSSKSRVEEAGSRIQELSTVNIHIEEHATIGTAPNSDLPF